MTVGTAPSRGFGLQDGAWLLGLAGGQNRSYINSLTATAGGTKAAGYQIPAGVALVQFDTVATNGDSALLPEAKAGSVVMVSNAGAATLALYGRGTDTINDAATANNYDLATNKNALFFCALDGQWKSLLLA